MPQYEFRVSLKIVHPTLQASAISEKLSVDPEIYSNVGTDRVSPTGTLLGGVYDHTIWSRSLTADKIDAEDMLFEEFIEMQNSKLSAHRNFFNEVRKVGGSVEYFVGWFSSGSINMNIALSSELMKSTSELSVAIVFCAYPDSDDA